MATIVQTVLQKMGNISKPHAQVITTILVLCGKVNFTNLSRYSVLNEKTYRRFFLKVFNVCHFNQVLVEPYVPSTHGLLAVMDVSFNHRHG